MKFEQFVDLYREVPFVDSSTFQVVTDKPEVLRRQVTEWQGKGYLHRLKRGIYLLDDRYRKTPVDPFFVANQLTCPSYVSLESALSFYDLIPEQTFAVTSVTPRGTRRFTNIMGTFIYRSIKPNLFFGYEPMMLKGQEFLIASREKAVLDYLYLIPVQDEPNSDWVDATRLQNLDSLNSKKLKRTAPVFGNKVGRMIDVLFAAGDFKPLENSISASSPPGAWFGSSSLKAYRQG